LADSARKCPSAFFRFTLSAAIACCNGDSEAAIAFLRKARSQSDAGLTIDRYAVQWKLGALLGGDEGKALLVEADGFFRRGGVHNVERYVAMLAPGLEIR
jgi:hypothetical protein